MTGHSSFREFSKEFQGRRPISASFLLMLICAVILIVAAWAWFTTIERITVAPGRVVPAGDVQLVEAQDFGVIRSIDVKEGEFVRIGQPLVKLDATVQDSQIRKEVERQLQLLARIERLTNELRGLPPAFSSELKTTSPELIASEEALYFARRSSQDAEVSVLERGLEVKKRERLQAESQLSSANRIADLLASERALLEPIVDAGVEPKRSLLTLQRQEEDIKAQIQGASAAIDRLLAESLEMEASITAMRNRFRVEAMDELMSSKAELAILEPALFALQELASRSTLKAPVNGIVNRIHHRTVGGTVREGEVVVEVVPVEDRLDVEAYVDPKDIAFLRVDQPVKVKFTAYDSSRYGSLTGHIVRIGADAVRQTESSETEVYIVDVQTEGTLIDGNGRPVKIIPGMMAQIDIIAGKRSIMEYLFDPLQKVKQSAFRE